MTASMRQEIARCGVCDVETVAPAKCSACGEPICVKHTRLRGPVGRREYVCVACQYDSEPADT